MIKLVDLGKQHKALENELNAAMEDIVANSSFIGGKPLANFESNFADFCGVDNLIGVSNGTTAIEVALRANGISQDDEVITVAHTFFATAEAILNVGAKPVFVDVNLVDGLMDISKIESAITKKTKAVIPVHLYGHLVNIKSLKKITDKYNLVIIEDAAQAHGASAAWGRPGQITEAATFSFYPGKNLGAWGDAGAIATNDNELASKYRKLQDHGRITKYEHDVIGMNARMDALQAQVLTIKLSKLKSWNDCRQEIAFKYVEKFTEKGFEILFQNEAYQSAWHLFVVRVANREEIQANFKEAAIETGIHYPVPLHKQPALQDMFSGLTLPVTEKLAKEIISLPLHPYLTDDEVSQIIELFLKIAKVAK